MPHYSVRGPAPDAAPAGFVPAAATATTSTTTTTTAATAASGGTRAKRRLAGKRRARGEANDPMHPAASATDPAASTTDAAASASDSLPPPSKKTKKEKKRERKAAAAAASATAAAETAPPAPDTPEAAARRAAVAAGRRVFVGHLQQATTQESLRLALAEYGEVVSVDLMTRKDTGRFKGSAFVDFADAASAAKAVAASGRMQLGGKPAILQLANSAEQKAEQKAEHKAPGCGGGGAAASAPPGPSVFVSNLPLGVHRPAVREAFGACGEVKRVKMLPPLPECARAFVDFHNADCAEKAVAMSGKVVLGRRLAVGFSVPKAAAGGGGGGDGEAAVRPRPKHEAGSAHRPACRCPKCLSGSGAKPAAETAWNAWGY